MESSSICNALHCTKFQRCITCASIAYILLPNLFFLLGWVESWVAVPLCVLLTICSWKLWQQSKPTCQRTCPNLKYLLFALLLAVLYVYRMGFNGDVPQPGDFIVRTPIYNTLIHSAWPIFSERGEYFVYYHAYVLPPAWIASILSFIPSWLILAAWVYLGIALAITCMFFRCGRATAIVFGLILFAGPLQALFLHDNVFLARHFPFEPLVRFCCAHFPLGAPFPGFYDQCANTYNHGINIFLFFSLAYGRLLSRRSLALLSPLLVVVSPLGAVAVLIYLLYLMVAPRFRKELYSLFKQPMLYVGILLIALLGIYFSSGEGSVIQPIWKHFDAQDSLPIYLVTIACILIPLFLFGWRYRQSAAFIAALTIALVTPIVWVGPTNNELLFKSAILTSFFVPIFAYKTFCYAGTLKRIAMIVVFVICSYNFIYASYCAARDFSTSDEGRAANMHDEWHGSLNHPEHYFYSRFWGENVPVLYKGRK